LFSGDPRNLPAAYRDNVEVANTWKRQRAPGGGEIWSGTGAKGIVWLATLAPDGESIAEHRRWVEMYRAGFLSPTRWWTWLAHRRPLADKTAAWLRVSCEPGDASEEQTQAALHAAFSAWRARSLDGDFRFGTNAR
jgi:hypothetical protein